MSKQSPTTAPISQPRDSMIGRGAFQWNAGGWFGSSLGSSAWMLILAFVVASKAEFLLASVLFAWFCVINLSAYVLWMHRNRIAPFIGIQSLLLVVAIAIPSAFFAVKHLASLSTATLIQIPKHTFWIYMIAPATMALFAFREWAARQNRSDKSTQSTKTGQANRSL